VTSGRARHQQKRCDDGCTAGVLPNRPIPCASCRARPIPRGHHATRGPDAVASACCPLPRAGRDLCPPVLLRVPPVPTPDTLLNAADSRPRPRRRGKKPGKARPGHVPSTLRACAKHSATHACTPSACMASAGSGGQQGWLPLAAPSVHSNHTGRRGFPCSATTVHGEHMHTGRRRGPAVSDDGRHLLRPACCGFRISFAPGGWIWQRSWPPRKSSNSSVGGGLLRRL
jgi:hypothetical protein